MFSLSQHGAWLKIFLEVDWGWKKGWISHRKLKTKEIGICAFLRATNILQWHSSKSFEEIQIVKRREHFPKKLKKWINILETNWQFPEKASSWYVRIQVTVQISTYIHRWSRRSIASIRQKNAYSCFWVKWYITSVETNRPIS